MKTDINKLLIHSGYNKESIKYDRFTNMTDIIDIYTKGDVVVEFSASIYIVKVDGVEQLKGFSYLENHVNELYKLIKLLNRKTIINKVIKK